MTNYDQPDLLLLSEVQGMHEEQEAALRSREIFYTNVTLENNKIFCADDCNSDEPSYIHMFGGGENPVYNVTVLQEAYEPGSTTQATFEGDTASMVPVLRDSAKCNPGVHSNEKFEHNPTLIQPKAESDDDFGCAWLKLRQQLSQHIADNGVRFIEQAKKLRPELFTDNKADEFTHKLIAAHGRMAANNAYFSNGRAVANVAVEAGAATMNVRGDHHPDAVGIINTVPNTSITNNEANAAGLPTYDHNSWATEQIYERLSKFYPYDKRDLAIADLIDALATLDVLGVKVVAVRRPEAV